MSQASDSGGQLARQIDGHVGERIRVRRTELGLTQEDLGRRLNISYQQVQKYETAANRVTAGRLYEIACELSVEVDYFFHGFDGARQIGGMVHGGHNRAAIDLVRNFQEIRNEDLRAAISTLLKAMRDYH